MIMRRFLNKIWISSLLFSLLISTYFLTVLNLNDNSRKCEDVLADCDGMTLNETVLPPFENYIQDFTVTSRYGISHCLLPKVMSTIATAAICYLHNPFEFKKANRTISTEHFLRRLCPSLGKSSFDEVKPLLKDPKNNIIMVRNPYDRFISGFIDKCVNGKDVNKCHGCEKDINCFLRIQFRLFQNIKQVPVFNVSDTHFAPQTWYCQMKNNLNTSTVIRYGQSQIERSQMIEDYVKVFKNANVPENEIAEVRKELEVGKSHHTTSGSETRKYYEQLIREDGTIRRALQRMYYYDFKILGFDM